MREKKNAQIVFPVRVEEDEEDEKWLKAGKSGSAPPS